MNTIGQRIKFLRTKHKLSMQNLADLVGKSKGNISGYESDKYEPSAQTIIAISKHMKVSTDWILTGEEFQYQNESKNDVVPISEQSYDMIQLFNLLDNRDKEDVYASIKHKYESSIKRGNSTSLYSTYIDKEKEIENSDNNTDGSGIA